MAPTDKRRNTRHRLVHFAPACVGSRAVSMVLRTTGPASHPLMGLVAAISITLQQPQMATVILVHLELVEQVRCR